MNPRRRDLLRRSIASTFVAVAMILSPTLSFPGGAAPAKGNKLNVLFIAVDDLNNDLGCYGHPVAKTPHIDRLASLGVKFDRAYCQYPLCNPSRTVLLSGRRPDTTGIVDNATPRERLGDLTLMPEDFRKHGYFTARVGKIAHESFANVVTWDVSEGAVGRGPDGKALPKKQAVPTKAAVEKAKARVKAQAKAQANEGRTLKLVWNATDRADLEERDGGTAVRIVELLEQHKDGPFFIAAGFHKPHLPWNVPRKYSDMYPPESMTLPKEPAGDRDDIPAVALTRTDSDEAMSDAQKRQAIAAYHAATTFTDAQVGHLLDAMDRLKLWDRTVVVLFGDHGFHLGEHGGLWRKMTVFEESRRVPLIVASPGKKAGAVSPRLVELVDLYPTLVDLCGLPRPSGLEGLSFAPLLDDPARPWKKGAFTQVVHGRNVMGRSVRTERYRYTEWGRDDVAELYDHQSDPHEYTNLARDPAHAAVVIELKRLLHGGWRAAMPEASH